MLDWTKIDNDKTFQRLVNHLFALECNSPGFVPSSPYIGADGKWDGCYRGYYPSENIEGIFSIQSKWTTKSFDYAFRSLRTQVKKELAGAKNKKVEHLRIVTNAKLRVEHVLNLQSLNKDEVKTLEVWYRENLTLRIERQPFLKHSFFGNPQHPVFVPWNIYFDKYEPHLISFSSIETPKFKEYINKIERFLTSNGNRLLIIHSPGNYGKSHFLREIAKVAYPIDSTRQTWLVRAGYREMKDAIQEEILSIDKKKYLLIFDDADKYLDDVKSLLSFLKSGNVDIKLILALKSSGIYLLQRPLREVGCSEISAEMKITEWKKDELIKLLRMTTGLDKVKDEELIVTQNPNPYLIVWIGRYLKGETISDFSKLRKKFNDDIIYDTEKCLRGVIDKEIEKFLFILACMVPFYKGNEILLKTLSSEFNINMETLKKGIKRLLNAGILRQVGRAIRFNPDMNGDLYLLYKLKDFDREELKTFILKWMPINPENIFVNIGEASKYEESNIIKEVLIEFLNQWINDAEKTPGSKRKEVMGWVKNIVFLVPEEVINLVATYLEISSPCETDPVYRTLGLDEIILTTDDYGPIIDELVEIFPFRSDVIDIIEKISTMNITGTYDNYKPLSLISKSVSPLENSLDNILSILNLFVGYLDEPNAVRIDFLKSALSEVLAGSHEFNRYYLGKVEWGEKPLKKQPKVLEIRNKAISILKEMIFHKLLDMQLASIEIAKNIGRPGIWIISEKDFPLAEKFAEERKDLVGEIGKLIIPNAEFRLLGAIEDLFIKWWAQDILGTANVANFLRSFPRTPEYIIFRYFASPKYVIENFSKLEAKAPGSKRWNWFVHEVMSNRYKVKPEYFSELVEEFNKTYKTGSEIKDFLIDLDKKLSFYQCWPRAQFLICWVRMNPKIFKKIREKEELWIQMPERFKEEIDMTLAKIYRVHIQKIAEEILDALPNVSFQKVNVFLLLIENYLSEPVWKDWIRQLIKSGNLEINARIIRAFYFIFEKTKDIEIILDFLIDIFSIEKKLTPFLIEPVAFLIHGLEKEMDKIGSKKEILRKKLLEMLKDESLSSWDSQEILGFCVEDVEEMIDFLEYRFNKQKNIGDKQEFKAVPFDGIICLKTKIKSFEDYLKLIKKIIYWSKSNVFLTSFCTERIMKSIHLQRDKETKGIYLVKSIKTLLQGNLITDTFICARFLPLTQETMDIFIEISEKGIRLNLYEEVKLLLFSKTFPNEVSWSSHGQSPTALVSIRNIFEEMAKKVSPGKLKNLINKYIKRIKDDMNDTVERDKEFLTSRG